MFVPVGVLSFAMQLKRVYKVIHACSFLLRLATSLNICGKNVPVKVPWASAVARQGTFNRKITPRSACFSVSVMVVELAVTLVFCPLLPLPLPVLLVQTLVLPLLVHRRRMAPLARRVSSVRGFASLHRPSPAR